MTLPCRRSEATKAGSSFWRQQKPDRVGLGLVLQEKAEARVSSNVYDGGIVLRDAWTTITVGLFSPPLAAS
jgi:hypothetical protein